MRKQFGEPVTWEDKIADKAAGAILEGASGMFSGIMKQQGINVPSYHHQSEHESSGGDGGGGMGGLMGAASSLLGGFGGEDSGHSSQRREDSGYGHSQQSHQRRDDDEGGGNPLGDFLSDVTKQAFGGGGQSRW